MTYATSDLNTLETGAVPAHTSASAPVRHARRRRHSAVMSHRSGGSRLIGLGI